MTKYFYSATLLLITTSMAHASLTAPPVDVPEIDVLAGAAAVAGVAAVVALMRERRRHKD